ncbi:hypothetical protein, partial [Paracoccus sp. SSK6]|uniref:hypothetical protein n=1 Tax=Paracoccus sp. SSK6 TaxID=3143131 RepID=UPI00321A42C9
VTQSVIVLTSVSGRTSTARKQKDPRCRYEQRRPSLKNVHLPLTPAPYAEAAGRKTSFSRTGGFDRFRGLLSQIRILRHCRVGLRASFRNGGLGLSITGRH